MDWLKLLLPQRRLAQETGKGPVRTTFEQDYDRIIFSQPFRKLQDKTQVFPLPEDDFVHTRLTHSLEVSSVGRSLGRLVGETILSRNGDLIEAGFSSFDFGTIVASASLAHDVGNPPFGHSGEQAISEYFKSGGGKRFQSQVSDKEWEDLINFEGNAQGFRILNEGFMKLTFPVLGAFSKYPRESLLPNRDPGRRSQKKFGFYQSESPLFEETANALSLKPMDDTNGMAWCRHPLAFLVEAADDICYHIIDLEDGCTLGLVSEKDTADLLINILGNEFDPAKYKRINTRQQRIGTLRAMTINKLTNQVSEVFLENEKEILKGDFDEALIDLVQTHQILDSIIDLSVKNLYQSKVVMQIEAGGFEVLEGLLSSFTDSMISVLLEENKSQKDKTFWNLIPESYKVELSENSTTYEILRSCLDFVSSMTDSYAISTYRKIKGISVPGF